MHTERKALRNASLAGGFVIGIAILIFIFNPSPMLVKIVSDAFPLALSITSAVLAYMLLHRQVKTRLGTRVWRWMTLGLILWAAGEAIWSIYELVLQQDVPYPSAADLMWITGYLPLILSLTFQFGSLKATISPGRKLLIAGILLGMIALSLWLVVVPILTDPEAGTPLEMFFNLAYPIGDLILLSLGVALVSVFLGGELALSWGAIAVGIILLSVSDLLFSYGTWNNLYYPDGQLNFLSGVFDTLYISADVVWAVGLFLRLRMPEAGKGIDMQAILSEEQNRVSDSVPSREEVSQSGDLHPGQAADHLGQIVQRAQEAEKNQRITGVEDPLRVYFNAVMELLDVLVGQAGGTGVGAAFESVVNEKARQMECAFAIHKGHAVWDESKTDAGRYQALLEEAIRYSKSVVATTAIDRKLQEIERLLPSRTVQAAEENRLRMVRWLEEKPE
jgi:hypothetical protein